MVVKARTDWKMTASIWKGERDAAWESLRRVRAKLATIDTTHLVALSQWLDIKFPGETGMAREVQGSLIEWAIAIDVARDMALPGGDDL